MSDSNSSSRTCANCGAPVATAAPEGLCPRCVAALNLGADTAFTGDGHATAPPPSPTPEELAPHFPQLEIIECLGRGGMGVVYQARQTSLGRLVALKLLAPERVSDAKFAERFAHEAKALAALSHPNIVTIHDFGQVGGFYFLLMEFVDGVNLRQAMKGGRFTPEQALAVVPPVCEALQYAHEHGIVHRDIKPENLLLDKDGRVKIADFGIAKLVARDSDLASAGQQNVTLESRATLAAGTPQYMAPEQKAHRRTDHRADIYSLGVVLYELLTGELPADKLQPPSRKVQINVRLDEIVLRALEAKPELRYQTAAEFRTQVETIAQGAAPAGEPTPAAPVGAAPTPMGADKPGSNPWIRLLRNVAIFIAISVLGTCTWYRSMQDPIGRSSAATPIPQISAATAAEVPAPTQPSARDTTPRAPTPTVIPANAEQLSQEGWQLWQSQKFFEALPKFREAVERAPDSVAAWNGLGWAALQSRKTEEAGKAFGAAIALEPTHGAALNGLGQSYLSRRDYAKAEPMLLKAAANNASAAWYGLTRLYLLQGQFADAEQWAQKLVDSGRYEGLGPRMLEAAKAKTLSTGLRIDIEPPTPTPLQDQTSPHPQIAP